MVRTRIYAAMHRANIPFAIPTQSILLTEQNESVHEQSRTRELEQKIKTLEQIELFKSLTVEERKNLATGLATETFLMGETITRQGAESHCLYIIVEGEAEVRVFVEGSSRRVAVIQAPDFFGEMGLLTGEPRSASVISLTDSHCYLLNKKAFEGIVTRRPEIAEQMASVLAVRREGLNAIREITSEEARRLRMASEEADLLNRIRKFFGISGGKAGTTVKG